MNAKQAIEKECIIAMTALKEKGFQFDEKSFRAAFYAGAVIGNAIMMEILSDKKRLLAKEGSAFCHFIMNQANRRN